MTVQNYNKFLIYANFLLKKMQKNALFCKNASFRLQIQLLLSQIKLSKCPPRHAQREQQKQNPKTQTRKSVVPVTRAHRHLHLNLIWHAVMNIHIRVFVKILVFENCVQNVHRVSILANYMRDINAICTRERVSLHTVSIFCNCHHLWRAASIHAKRHKKKCHRDKISN